MAREQFASEVLFQLLDGDGKRRLRHVQSLRRLAEAAAFRERHELMELPELHSYTG